MTLAQAKVKASKWRDLYKNGETNLRAALIAEQQERDRERAAREAAAHAAHEAETAKHQRTLGALLTAYTDQLARDGKSSAREVRVALHHHVRDARPKLWAASLADIDTDALLAIIAEPADAGKLRQAEKLRAYLRAAYSAGMKARHNAKALPALRGLRVTTNPARDLTPIEGANKARHRALSLAELRAYWQRICHRPDYAALRFHLLTGGQRIEQLARVTQADYDVDTQSIRIMDTKGRRTNAREHHVPLLLDAIDALRSMHGGEAGPYLFTLTGGLSGADASGIFKRVHAVAGAMLANDELPGGTFTPSDLRRTVETRLADAGVSREVRAHLQSHGLGGIQERHYDRHDYLPETREALETLRCLLTSSDTGVTPIRRKRA
jgi:integrase